MPPVSEFDDWRQELKGAQLVAGRWVKPRRPSALPFIFAAAGILLAAALTAAVLAAHGA